MAVRTSIETISEREIRLTHGNNKADTAYNAERDRMVERHKQEMQKSYIINGTLVIILVKEALGEKRQRAPPGCMSVPAIVENKSEDGRRYQVKAHGTLIVDLIKREHMMIVVNDSLREELDKSHMPNAKGISLLEYCYSSWMPRSVAPKYDCRSGCKNTSTCPCRKAGYKCGSDCHPSFYENYGRCNNYKDHTCR